MSFWAATVIVAIGVLAPLSAFSQTGPVYPARAVRLIVPFPPGASTDTTGRAVAQKLSESIGQPVVVENRPGASGIVGADLAAKAPPDGYTLLLNVNALYGVGAHFYKSLPFDVVKDFTPITAAAEILMALVVHASVPVNSVRELIDYARRNPGKLAYGTSGTGSGHHIAGEMLRALAGVDIVHVPYKGGGPASADLLGGQIPMAILSVVAVMPHATGGKMKVLGVLEATRYERLPDVPTMGETLSGWEANNWLGFFAPAGLPSPILARLNGEMVKALNAPEVRGRLDANGLRVIANSAEQFAAMIRKEVGEGPAQARKLGIRAE